MILLSFLYDLCLMIGTLCYVPINAFHILWQGKAKRWIFTRLKAAALPKIGKDVIWLHAASLGETKALLTLIPEIKQDYPESHVVLSVITVVGYNEAKKHAHLFDTLFYLPLDFSWVMRKMMRTLRPKMLILVEGDFWLHMIYYAKKYGAKVALASGSISSRSVDRYLLVPFLKKHLFAHIDAYGLQSEHYSQRFQKLGIEPGKMAVTGNIKLSFDLVNEKEKRDRSLPFASSKTLITVGCTHHGEEEAIAKSLRPLFDKYPSLVVAFAPRHLNRASEVQTLLEQQLKSCDTLETLHADSRVILIDKMGVLDQWYKRSTLAIMGGSFFPGVGGHNIFEPILSGAVPLFGPHMESQLDLAKLILDAGAGLSITIQDLEKGVTNLLTNKPYLKEIRERGEQLKKQTEQTAKSTWRYIHAHTSNPVLT